MIFGQRSNLINDILKREADERQGAVEAASREVGNIHIAMAERLADEAWRLAEESLDTSYVPSTLWSRSPRSVTEPA